MAVWYFSCWLGLNHDKQRESIKVKLPEFPICQQSSQRPRENLHLQQLVLEAARVQLAEHSDGFPCSLGVRLRVTEMSQDAERLPAAGAKGFFVQQSPGFPTCGGASAQSQVQSEVGCCEKSLCWQMEGAKTAFILVSPSFSEWSILLFQCSRDIILIFKCYFI